jgi:hypothetical protein
MDAPNKSLDASGGSVFLNLLGAAKGALIRAAASTQPFGASRRLGRLNMTRRLLPSITLATAITLSLSCRTDSMDHTQRLVHDAKTGQYIGVVRGECRVWGKEKDTITYRVERSDGTTIDIPADKVTLSEQ